MDHESWCGAVVASQSSLENWPRCSGGLTRRRVGMGGTSGWVRWCGCVGERKGKGEVATVDRAAMALEELLQAGDKVHA